MNNPASKSIIIFGSSRSNGNTRKAIDTILGSSEIKVVDLNTMTIKPFDYEYKNQSDDFIPLVQMFLSYEQLVFASPVYWYTMSSIMKVFMDRFSDLLDLRRDLGRRLRGKKMFVGSPLLCAHGERSLVRGKSSAPREFL
jgi:multimeric flavodoxin WrbA